MPMLHLRTNVAVDALLTSDILHHASSSVAKLLCKPQKSVMVLLEDNIAMHYNGGDERAAWGELVSIGGLGPEQNESLCLAISGILEEMLNIPKSHIYLRFQDAKQDPCFGHLCCMHVMHQ